MKTQILNLLKSNPDSYVSGEQISEQLGVSRTAVWKHIKALKAEGYAIDSVNNKGYRLISDTDEINRSSLESVINQYSFLDFGRYHSSIDSTNSEAKRLAIDGDTQGIVVAGEQTKGKGRLGRDWASENGTGLWMSLLLRPNLNPEVVSAITLVAAAAMTEAIESLAEVKVGIKWPNDLVVNGKKVCGILTEMSAEINRLHYIVIGIGVNVAQLHFPEELSAKATSLKLEGVSLSPKNLLERFLETFARCYGEFLNSEMSRIIEFHKSHSVTLGKDVKLVTPTNERMAYAVDINEDGSLTVQNETGHLEKIFTGEVSVRGIDQYV